MKLIIPTTNGLVGYWSFDEGAGTIAHDFSGKGNHVNLAGQVWTDGVKGKALKFNSNSMALSHQLVPTASDRTISFWVKADNDTVQMGVCGNRTGANSFAVTLNRSGNGRLTYLVGLTAFETLNVIIPNRWVHIVITVNSNFGSSYVNGVLASTLAGMNAETSPGAFLIGNQGNGSNFSGIIDELRIYNRALSPDEIATLYQAGGMKLLPPKNAGLVGYWSFDEGAGTVAHDYSSAGNHGALVNAPEWVDGVRGKCLRFNGVNQYVRSPSISISNDITVSVWVNYKNASNQMFVEKSIVNLAWALFIEGGVLNWRGASASGLTAPLPPINKWNHICAIRIGLYSAIYVNGLLVAQSAAINLIADTNGAINMGCYDGAGYFLNGSIDEVRIYNRALQQSEIIALYQAGAEKLLTASNRGLVGYWSFEENAGTIAHDYSGRGNHGLLNGQVWTNGVRGKCLSFNGVELSCLSQIEPIGSDKTLSAWIKPQSNIRMGILGQRLSAGFFFSVNRTSVGNLSFFSGGTLYEINALVPLYKWSYVCVTVLNNIASIYLNGVLLGSSIVGAEASDSSPLKIGSEGIQNPFIGLIDEVRVYTRALSPKEVMDLYLS